MRKCALLLLLYAGCSYTFDETLPEVPLLGDPPAAQSLQRLNQIPVESARLMAGADGVPWLAMHEEPDTLRLRRLAVPGGPAGEGEEVYPYSGVEVQGDSLFMLAPAAEAGGGERLIMRSPGEAGPGEEFLVPAGPSLLMVGGRDDVLLYWARVPETRSYDILRRDGSYRRTLPLPAGLDPQAPQDLGLFFFDSAGQWLYVRDAAGLVTAHSTTSERDVTLGVRPRALWLDEEVGALITCGDDGLRRVPLDGSAERALIAAPCDAAELRFLGRDAFYKSAAGMVRAPLDGSAPAAAVLGPGAEAVLAEAADGGLAYTQDPPGRYASGAGDGWIGPWQFMKRGRLAAFSGDGRRVRWLEDAATDNGAGDLRSAMRGGGAGLLLAHNVRSYSELADGRLLVVADYAFRGPQNRVITVDERSGQARWVVDGASNYIPVPGTQDLVVYLVRETGFDMAQVSIPPP